MSFYQSISEVYSQIFPLNKQQVKFVNEAIAEFTDSDLLDVGCGTGELAIGLASSVDTIVGIDLDQAMLKKARIDAKGKAHVKFICMNMMDIGKEFGPESFDAVTCFGNTLVHLDTMDQISDFIQLCSDVLKTHGKLLIQIINYDRILDDEIRELPTIENDQIHFIRNYSYLKSVHRIDFETILTIKADQQEIKNSIRLIPIRLREILNLLESAGFYNVESFSNFGRNPYVPTSTPLVIEASRKLS
jgi:2-polyprenyl-3-methyl-5-hydroxy-6-metoxy-1,4-benzoquinol methylase